LSPRSAVATYLQTLILLAVAVGGSVLVYQTVGVLATDDGGPGVAVAAASATQGADFAVESITVSNTGNSPVTSMTILNPGLSASNLYCYSVWSQGGVLLSNSCPSMSTDPRSVALSFALSPGSSVNVQLTLDGGSVFSLGTAYPLTVVTSSGAQASTKVEAVPG